MEKKGLEYALGKGLMQPFNVKNSGNRKLMYSVHLEQALRLTNSEVAEIQAGYEQKFGDLSSSILKFDQDFTVVAKIIKFSKSPNSNYILIIKKADGEYDLIEKCNYKHISESYGYTYNFNNIDDLTIDDIVSKDTIMRTSISNDEFMNRKDGSNLLVSYISSDKVLEDGIVLSESSRRKLATKLIKKVTVFIGKNDIFLNLYGDDNNFKSFPDIGEEIENNLLCALRKENIEECLYMQSLSKLREPLMSDDKFIISGKVIDINIYNNDRELDGMMFERHTNSQLLYYYNEHLRYIKDFVEIINTIKKVEKENGRKMKMSFALNYLYTIYNYELSGMKIEKDNKVPEGAFLDIYVFEDNLPRIGDKITNRAGSKGVISAILPDNQMPLLDNGKRLDAYINPSSPVNRLSSGPVDELSLTFTAHRLIEYINNNLMSSLEAIQMIIDYINIISPSYAEFVHDKLFSDETTPEDRDFFLESITSNEKILLSLKPASDRITLDLIANIYKKFPFIKPYTVYSEMVDSNGNIRQVKGRRTLIAGSMYFYRLKQYAEEKFSATSLSSTNLTNENTKSKASKNYMSIFPNTPIRFGEMETEDERHMGSTYVVQNLMIHSTSPQARRLIEKFIEEDPYSIDIKLDGTCKNRNAEKAKVYLKAMGLEIKIVKIPKVKKKLVSCRMNDGVPLFYKINPNEKISGEEIYRQLKAKEEHRKKKLFRKRAFTNIEENDDK